MPDLEFTAQDVYRSQRTEKGLEYDRKRKELRKKLLAKDSNTVEMVKAVSEELWSRKSVSTSAVHANQFLTNVSVQYANDEYIGERLMPVVPGTSARTGTRPTTSAIGSRSPRTRSARAVRRTRSTRTAAPTTTA